jgi:hypothetical protein
VFKHAIFSVIIVIYHYAGTNTHTCNNAVFSIEVYHVLLIFPDTNLLLSQLICSKDTEVHRVTNSNADKVLCTDTEKINTILHRGRFHHYVYLNIHVIERRTKMPQYFYFYKLFCSFNLIF